MKINLYYRTEISTAEAVDVAAALGLQGQAIAFDVVASLQGAVEAELARMIERGQKIRERERLTAAGEIEVYRHGGSHA